jgi:hypothetical protein
MAGSEAEWRLLVRRAFGVPDLIGDEVALAIVADAIYNQQELVGMQRQLPVTKDVLAIAVWDAVVKAGVDGDLDAFLTDRPEVTNVGWYYNHVIERVRTTLDNQNVPAGVVASLLTVVHEFVQTHRFRDDSGRYFF